MQSESWKKSETDGRNNIMKYKAILLSLIFVLSSAPGASHAAAASRHTKSEEIARLLVLAKMTTEIEKVKKIEEVVHYKISQMPPAQPEASKKLSPDEAKATLKTIAKAMHSDYLLSAQETASKLNEAITQAKIIHNSYFYFNPYRYLLGNKISALQRLQERAEEANSPEKAKNYQNEAKKELEYLISWLG